MARSKRKGRKDAQFVIRLDSEMRDRFLEICEELDTSGARELRRFIKRFIREHEDGSTDHRA